MIYEVLKHQISFFLIKWRNMYQITVRKLQLICATHYDILPNLQFNYIHYLHQI